MSDFYRTIKIICGNALLVIGVYYFILPYNIITGGLAGLANIINAIMPINKVLLLNILNIILFLVGWLFLGKQFALNTCIATITYPILLKLVSLYSFTPNCSNISAAVYGGAVCGLGLGIVFRNNASTGGTDVPILIIHKYTGIEVSQLELLVDGLISIMGIGICGLDALLLGLLSICISSITINKVMQSETFGSVMLYIISNSWVDIKTYIQDKLQRGSTLMHINGGYQNEEKCMIMVVVSRNQYAELIEYISKADRNAFVFTCASKDVFGNGFSLSYHI